MLGPPRRRGLSLRSAPSVPREPAQLTPLRPLPYPHVLSGGELVPVQAGEGDSPVVLGHATGGQLALETPPVSGSRHPAEVRSRLRGGDVPSS